jgi:hypothetical protein
MGVPKRNLAGFDRLNDEKLPGVILQDQVAQELVVGHGDAAISDGIIGKRAPGLKGEQVIGRQEGLAAEDDGPEEEDSQAKQADDYNQGWELVSIKPAHYI